MSVRIKNFKKQISNMVLRLRVKHRDFTIISADCWGSSIYQELGIAYNTPFVGLFLYAPCYINLLQNLEKYLLQDLRFTGLSKYNEANQYRASNNHHYPIGLLGDDTEIHFLHYANEEEAYKKWERRKARMNMQNLFVAFSDRNLCTEEHLLAFDLLPYKQKIVFTSSPAPQIHSAVWLKNFSGRPYIANIYTHREKYRPYFDVADWLNGGSGKPIFLYRIINLFFNA